jgi:hypothetical protein
MKIDSKFAGRVSFGTSKQTTRWDDAKSANAQR